MCLILEYVSGGDLLSFLRTLKLNLSMVIDMYVDIANGMMHLHVIFFLENSNDVSRKI